MGERVVDDAAVKRAVEHNRCIRSLPDDIISNIISRLSLPSGSVINISGTTFDVDLSHVEPFRQINCHNLWTALDAAFSVLISPSSIKSFRLNFANIGYLADRYWFIIHSWVHRLCFHNNVEDFKVTSYSDHSFYFFGRISPYFFRMHSLVSLDLGFSPRVSSKQNRDDLINDINLPRLKKLVLSIVRDDWHYALLDTLLASCPSLEDLSITTMTCINVSSKKLKRLSIRLLLEPIYDVFNIDAPNLKHFEFLARYRTTDYYMGGKLLDSISHVESLVLDARMGFDTSKPSTITFPNLTHLTWNASSYDGSEALVSMLHCPKLKR